MKKVLLTLTLASLTLLIANENATAKGKRVPPQEAISACSGKSENSSCSVITPRGNTLEGSCKNTPDGKYFACISKNHKPQRR
ncbi:MAG: hypothetical protein U9N49_09145 [Campylobacterota bacterium]|nr:hypothetical protein [Campylobacterota bacterium]